MANPFSSSTPSYPAYGIPFQQQQPQQQPQQLQQHHAAQQVASPAALGHAQHPQHSQHSQHVQQLQHVQPPQQAHPRSYPYPHPQPQPQYPLQQPLSNTHPSRFDANSQIQAPPAFQFPSGFDSEMLKHLASVGLPPPPPPGFSQVPLPTVAIPPFTSAPSPYPQTMTPGNQMYAAWSSANQGMQPLPEAYTSTPPQLSKGGHEMKTSYETDARPFGTPKRDPPRPVRAPVEPEKDEALPSFGSRSDVDSLFAAAQMHSFASGGNFGNLLNNSMAPANGHSGLQPSTDVDRSSSPYDPTRPMTLPNALSSVPNQPGHHLANVATSNSSEKDYVLKPLSELRQLAKGALLSLVPHKIQYIDLLREGINAEILRQLFDELGLKVDEDPTTEPRAHAPNHDLPTPAISTRSAVAEPRDTSPAGPAIADLRKEQPAPSPSLERKDRIAQLLAAKAGRPAPAAASPTPSSTTLPPTSAAPGSLEPLAETANAQQDTTPAKAKPQAQAQLVKERTEQLRQEVLTRSQVQSSDNASGIPSSLLQGSALASMIPGLFMTSADASGQDLSTAGPHTLSPLGQQPGSSQNILPNSESYSLTNSSLKRPLMPDTSLDTLQPQAKRVHQHEELHRMIGAANNVEDAASEGEILEDREGDAMDIASEDADQHVETNRAERPTTSDVLEAAEQSQHFSANQNDSPTSAVSGALYEAKQSEIEAMRKRIAEMEQRKQLKRSRSQVESPVSTNPPTPSVSREDQALSSSPVSTYTAASGAASGTKSQTKQPSATRNIKLTPAQLAERAAVLKAEFLRQRAQRQHVLQAGLPDLNAEVQKTESQIGSLRKELARVQALVEQHEADLKQAKGSEQSILGEIHMLEKRLAEGRTGQRQYSDELQKIQLEKLAESQEGGIQEDGKAPPVQTALTSTLRADGPSPISAVEPVIPKHAGISQPGDAETNSEILNQPPTTERGEFAVVPSASLAELGEASTEIVQEIQRADTFQTDDMEMSTSPSPDSNSQAQPEQNLDSRNHSGGSEMEMGDESDGSASMSDSGSDEDDYEPAEPAPFSSAHHEAEEDEYNPEETLIQDVSPTKAPDDDADDFYEPTEHVELIETPGPHPSAEIPQGDASTPADTPGGMDAMDGEDGEDGEIPDEAPMVSTVPPAAQPDDTDHPLQLSESEALTKTQPSSDGKGVPEHSIFLEGNARSSAGFVPYVSPLTSMKNYRFHPEYKNSVKSGFKSLTYSNNINPTLPLCGTELAGETCADPACDYQHFRQLGLSDDKILVQLSASSDIKDKATRDTFLLGLKQVIADLRQQNVKEFEEVATALSAYRRRFFADNLGDASQL